MSIPFAELKKLKALKLSLSAILVLSYYQEHGPTPYGLIAQACGISIRSVELAFEKFKQLDLLTVAKNFSHEHVKTENKDIYESPQISAAETERICDPLEQALLDTGLKPWAVQDLLAKMHAGEFPRERVENQLAYHQHRLNTGYAFKNPQGFLYRAIVQNWLPLDNYHRDQQPDAPPPAKPVTPEPERPVVAPPLTDAEREAQALEWLASPNPAVRRAGLRAAQEMGLDVARLQAQIPAVRSA